MMNALTPAQLAAKQKRDRANRIRRADAAAYQRNLRSAAARNGGGAVDRRTGEAMRAARAAEREAALAALTPTERAEAERRDRELNDAIVASNARQNDYYRSVHGN